MKPAEAMRRFLEAFSDTTDVETLRSRLAAETARADGAERAHDQLVEALAEAHAEIAALRQALENRREVR